MATTLKKLGISVNVGNIVDGAIKAVKAARSTEQSRRENEFQKASADGMSYDAQIAFREKQIQDAKDSDFADPEYITSLETKIAETKRLNRLNKYRTKYAQSLAEMNAGHINAVEYADRLKNLVGSTNDPELQLKIQENIAEAETEVTKYKKTILDNQVKLAKGDVTKAVLESIVQRVKDARANAAIGGNEDEVVEHDATLASLNSQLVQVKAEDVVNDLVVAGTFSSYNSKEKLNTLNAQIEASDAVTPVTINGKGYASEQQYWELTRNAYISGNGSGIFTDYFNDLNTANDSRIKGDVAKFGFAQTGTIQGMKTELESLKAKPEFAPYLPQIESIQTQTISAAVDTISKVIVDRADYTGEFAKADTALKSLTNTFGVDTSLQQLNLGAKLNAQVNAVIAAGGEVPPGTDILPGSEFPIPGDKTQKTDAPATPATPNAPVTPPATSGTHKVVAGENLGKIAAQNGVTLTQLLDANPEYKANPALVKIDAVIKLPGAQPAAPIVPVTPNTPTPPVKPTVPPTKPPVTAPVTPPVKPPVTTNMTPDGKALVAPTTPPATPMRVVDYTILPGDTLTAIAARNKTTVSDLARINAITDVNKIQSGQKIKLQ